MNSPKVIAYYSPKNGDVERHEMWRIDYNAAKAGPDGALWSLEAPKGKTPVVDKVPQSFDGTSPVPASPPPTVERIVPPPATVVPPATAPAAVETTTK